MSYIKNNQSPSNAKTKEVTGFVSPELITISYNSTNRTFTLSGTVEAYYQGKLINVLINGWTSTAHPEGKTVSQFLYYNGTDFIWSDNAWLFSYLQIARTFYDSGNLRHVGFQEQHGFLQWQTHENLHYNIGARKIMGGQSSGTVLNSTTVTDRRPDISQSINADEDLLVTIPALTSKTYTRFFLSGTSANPVTNFSIDNTDIISLSTNRPYYNQLTGGNWVQTLMPTNSYTSVYVIQMPVSTDIDSQKYRFLFVQGQNISQGGNVNQNATALANQLALDPASLVTDGLNILNPEYCIIHQYVIKYDGTNWTLQGEQDIVGNKQKPVIVSGTTGLTSVNVDETTITGNGALTPLSVINPYTPKTILYSQTVDVPYPTNSPSAVDTTTNIITHIGHGFTSGNTIEITAGTGVVPSPITLINQPTAIVHGKAFYWVTVLTPDTYKLYTDYARTTELDLTTEGTVGWKARIAGVNGYNTGVITTSGFKNIDMAVHGVAYVGASIVYRQYYYYNSTSNPFNCQGFRSNNSYIPYIAINTNWTLGFTNIKHTTRNTLYGTDWHNTNFLSKSTTTNFDLQTITNVSETTHGGIVFGNSQPALNMMAMVQDGLLAFVWLNGTKIIVEGSL